MNGRQQRQLGKRELEVIEEAVHLLRRAPVRVLAGYYCGTLPFVLGLLYFWADMSCGAFAWQHCADAAFGLAVLYLWMKSWHAVFARALHRQIGGPGDEIWTWRRLGRLVSVQAWLQSTGLFILPVAALIALPFGWVYAFYHNLSLFGDGSEPSLKVAARRAWQQAALWPQQNHVLAGVLWLFGVCVFANVALGLMAIPVLLKMLLGIESRFTMSYAAVLNTTYLATCAGVTYLCLNPLIKATYVLRCFYGESLQSAADLRRN